MTFKALTTGGDSYCIALIRKVHVYYHYLCGSEIINTSTIKLKQNIMY